MQPSPTITEPPDPDESQRVWRYMSFSRFVWMLQKKQLWMSRIDLLGDPWEMTLSGPQLAFIVDREPVQPITSPRPTETTMQRSERIIKLWRRMTFVNCWSASEHESHALWKIYCLSHEGVAIQTTMGKLKRSVGGLPVHRVKYCEPGSNRITPTLSQLATEKRPMFAYEHEVRVVLKTPDEPEDPSKETVGHGLQWDPEAAIERVVVHPAADYSFMEAVMAVIETYAPALKANVPWSAMQLRPPF